MVIFLDCTFCVLLYVRVVASLLLAVRPRSVLAFTIHAAALADSNEISICALVKPYVCILTLEVIIVLSDQFLSSIHGCIFSCCVRTLRCVCT